MLISSPCSPLRIQDDVPGNLRDNLQGDVYPRLSPSAVLRCTLPVSGKLPVMSLFKTSRKWSHTHCFSKWSQKSYSSQRQKCHKVLDRWTTVTSPEGQHSTLYPYHQTLP